ncbi:MAG: NAD(P)H-dependent oxidoreductase [Caulobacterales bacterium]|jgi:putative NADPH-quinone reductase
MLANVCVLQGHPHPNGAHFCHALADAYSEGANAARHDVSRFDLGAIDAPILHDPKDFLTPAPAAVQEVQQAVLKATHIVVVYPLWLGTMPATVKAFFEQFARAEFAIGHSDKGWPRRMLKGRSARVIVTMGMPAEAYRLVFGAHGVRGFESAILGMAGFAPIHETFIGGIEGQSAAEREKWLKKMRDHGERAD